MQTLFTRLSPIVNASYSLTNVTNLVRMAKYNQEQFEKRVLETSYRLSHANPLVQLLEFMQINPEWSEEELVDIVNLKTDRWSSMASAVGVYNSGRLQRNILFRADFRELLISLPPQYEFTDYFTIPDEKLCPFIPVFSDSCELDYRPVKEKSLDEAMNHFGFIGIDFMALAVGWWRQLKHAQVLETDASPEKWLAKYPLMNAQLLANRLIVLNALYLKIVTGRPIEELITVPKTPYEVNRAILTHMVRVTKKYDELLHRKPLRNLESLVLDGIELDDLPIPPLNPMMWKEPGEYELYMKSRWVWNFAYMKALTVLFHYNRITRTPNGAIRSMTKRWLQQDVKLSTQQIKDKALVQRFKMMRTELEKVV